MSCMSGGNSAAIQHKWENRFGNYNREDTEHDSRTQCSPPPSHTINAATSLLGSCL